MPSRLAKVFEFLVEMGFHHVSRAGLKLLTFGDLPASASHSARIIGVSHCAWPALVSYCCYNKYINTHLLFYISGVQTSELGHMGLESMSG